MTADDLCYRLGQSMAMVNPNCGKPIVIQVMGRDGTPKLIPISSVHVGIGTIILDAITGSNT